MAAPWAVGDNRLRGAAPPGLGPPSSQTAGEGSPDHAFARLAARRDGEQHEDQQRRMHEQSASEARRQAVQHRRDQRGANRRHRRRERMLEGVPSLQLPPREGYAIPDVLARTEQVRQNWKIQRAADAHEHRAREREARQREAEAEAAAAEAAPPTPVPAPRPGLLQEVEQTQALLASVRTEEASLDAYKAHFRQYDAGAAALGSPSGDAVLATKLRLRKLSRKQLRLLVRPSNPLTCARIAKARALAGSAGCGAWA